MALLWAKYNQSLVARPVITKGLTGGTLFSTGDLIAQYLDGTLKGPEGYNPYRTLVSFCWSSCIFAPIGHQWYAKFLPKCFPTSSFKDSASKVICDQTVFATCLNSLYLTYSTITHGGTIQDAQNKVKNDLFTVLKGSWCVWPWVQIFAFRFVPIPLQMPVFNVAVLFWSAFLATIGNKDKRPNVAVTSATTHTPLASPVLLTNTTIPPSPHVLASLYEDSNMSVVSKAVESEQIDAC